MNQRRLRSSHFTAFWYLNVVVLLAAATTIVSCNRRFPEDLRPVSPSLWLVAAYAFEPSPRIPFNHQRKSCRIDYGWIDRPSIKKNYRHVSHLLFMAGGSKSLNNKQTALRQKMELAKRQKMDEEQQHSSLSNSKPALSDQEVRERNDRLRFEELLRKGSVNVFNDCSADGYLSRKQEEEEIDAVRAGKDLLFEGDPAPTDCFEELVSIKSENAIGSTGKQRIVPWLHKNVARHDDYIVVLTDPRMQSLELRESVKILLLELPKDIQSRLIVINADSPAENRRWLKKSGFSSPTNDDIQQPTLEVYSDEKMEWMRSYTALGDKRWSLSMFVLAAERIQKLAREVDQYGASRTIQNAVKAHLEDTRVTIRNRKLE